MPHRRRPRLLPLLLVPLLLGCQPPPGPPEAAPAPAPAAPGVPEDDAPQAVTAAPRPEARAAPLAGRLERVRWPEHWRVTGNGGFATPVAEVAWLSLEADAAPPAAAAQAATERLVAAFGPVELSAVAAEQPDADRAVGHIRGESVSGVIEARREERLTVVRIELQSAAPAPPATTP